MKKIILLFILIFSFSNTYAAWTWDTQDATEGSVNEDIIITKNESKENESTDVNKIYEDKKSELKDAEEDLKKYKEIEELENSKKEELPDYNWKIEEYDSKIKEIEKLKNDNSKLKEAEKEAYQKQIDALIKEKEKFKNENKEGEYNKKIDEKNNKIEEDNKKIDEKIENKKGDLKNSELNSLEDAKNQVKGKEQDVYDAKIDKAEVDLNSEDKEVAKDAAAILYDDWKKKYSENIDSINEKYDSQLKEQLENCSWSECSLIEKAIEEQRKKDINTENEKLAESREQLREKERAYANSAEWSADLTSFGFKISTSDLTPGQIWWNISWKDFDEKGNFVLGTIIQSLMMALWVLSVFIMTVGGGYIILNNGQDELLNKWKSIFMSWVYAMIIALSSYVVVAMVRFILYSNTN